MAAVTQPRATFPFTGMRYAFVRGNNTPDFMHGTLRIVPHIVGKIAVEPAVRGKVEVNP